MKVNIHLPTALRPYADRQEVVTLEGRTAGEALQALTVKYPTLNRHLRAEDGRLRNFVNVYLNEEDIRHLKGPETPVHDGDTLLIVPSIAGGAVAAIGAIQPRSPAAGGAVAAIGAIQPRSPAAGGAVAAPPQSGAALTPEEIKRYSRHLIMPEVGMEGQRKLKRAKVLLVGAGGLGSPSGLYLAAAGVGNLGIVDFDVVDFSNLQRQILHSTDSVGQPKLESAKRRLLGLNPSIEVRTHEAKLTSQNALDLFKGYDVIADGADNFPTRYLVNDACALLGKPNVYGSIFRFEGQISVFWAERGPCYRCLYSEPPPPGLVPSCAEGGVLGVLPGVIGTLQATEVIKLLLGIGKPLVGQLMLFDALAMEWRKLKLRKDPDCPLCGTHPTIRSLIDYEEFCGLRGQEAKPETQGIPEISVEELKARLDRREDVFILDVREPQEYDICRLPGSKLIPLGQIPERVHELNSADSIVAHCKMGGRSAKAVRFLREAGFKKIVNLAGGIHAWAERIDPSMPTY